MLWRDWNFWTGKGTEEGLAGGEGEELCLTGKAQTPEVGDRRAASPRS